MSAVRDSIVTWLHSQQYWVQVASNKILKKEPITDKSINELYELMKTAEGQKTGKLVDFTSLQEALPDGHELRLNSIGEIFGIDNLSPRTPLDFKENMSVIYGNNGSGKSGYTRILKKACGKAANLDLISNVFLNKPEVQKCTINYSENGTAVNNVWLANTIPIPSLRGLDIFDASAGGFYLENENEASYLPLEVALFEILVSIFEALKVKLDKDIKEKPTKLPTKPTEYGNTKYLEGMYVKLKADSDSNVVKKFYDYSEADEKTKDLLEERIKTAPSVLASQKRNRKKQLQNFYTTICESSTKVNNKSCDEIFLLQNDVKDKKKVAHEAAAAITGSSVLSGIGLDTWKNMWLAAKKYSEEESYKGIKYPNIGKESVCVLCQQDLGDTAKTRLSGFDLFITSKLESELKTAQTTFEKRLNELPIIPNETSLRTSLQACQLEEDIWFPKINLLWTKVNQAKEKILQKGETKVSGFNLDITELAEINALIEQLEAQALGHDTDGQSFDLNKAQLDLKEIQSKKWASGYVSMILQEITRLAEIDTINALLKFVNTKGLSAKSGEISEKCITEAYIQRFNNELKDLGAVKIGVELVKSRVTKGSVKHRIQLKNMNASFAKMNLNPLSEGEKRVISLAAFLADVTGKPYKAPFVFDDPISSLDQTYEEKTANRLVELSKDRQVIVFTHRLSLLGLLNDKSDAHCKHIRRETWGCGEHGEVPLYGKRPISAIKELKNDRLAKAKKVYEESGVADYSPLAKSICSDFRILLERVIEVDFLAGIVQRHRRSVVTKDKMKHLAKIKIEDCEKIEALMTDFSVFEHSQTDEAPVELPTPDDLLKAMDSVIDWHKEFGER